MHAAETASLDLANTENTLFGLANTRKAPQFLLMACAIRSFCYLFYITEKKVQDEKPCESKQVL
jgi:hypothetical protein